MHETEGAIEPIKVKSPYDVNNPVGEREILGGWIRQCFEPYDQIPEDSDPVCQNCKHEDLCKRRTETVLAKRVVNRPKCTDPAEIAKAHEALAKSQKVCVSQRSFTEEFYVLCEKDEYGRWDRLTFDTETLENIWKLVGLTDRFFEADGREYAIFKRTVTVKDDLQVPLVRYHDLVHFYDTQVGTDTPKAN